MKFAHDGNYQVIFWLFDDFRNGSLNDSTTAGGLNSGLLLRASSRCLTPSSLTHARSKRELAPSVVNLSKLETD